MNFNCKIKRIIMGLFVCLLWLQQEVSPRTSGRLSHSSGPLNGSLTDSPPVSPSEMDDIKVSLSLSLPFFISLNSMY